MIRRPPRSTRTATSFPSTTLFLFAPPGALPAVHRAGGRPSGRAVAERADRLPAGPAGRIPDLLLAQRPGGDRGAVPRLLPADRLPAGRSRACSDRDDCGPWRTSTVRHEKPEGGRGLLVQAAVRPAGRSRRLSGDRAESGREAGGERVGQVGENNG